jgi:hypothetical protein
MEQAAFNVLVRVQAIRLFTVPYEEARRTAPSLYHLWCSYCTIIYWFLPPYDSEYLEYKGYITNHPGSARP